MSVISNGNKMSYNIGDLSNSSTDSSLDGYVTDFSISYDTSGRVTTRSTVVGNRPGTATCNETKAHNNEEKAFYHGLKSAYRMSREFDGEYGTSNPPWETAARIAANVAIAYLETTGQTYTREESYEYVADNVFDNIGILDRIKQFFAVSQPGSTDAGPASEEDLELGIGQAWTQVDDKWNHYDAARTALATAEAYLGEQFNV